MRLRIENIGAIVDASIEISNITVIAGENDSGKSTIGKVFFSLIQAFANYPIVLQSERNQHIRRELERIFIDLRRNFDLANFPAIRDAFMPPRLTRRFDLIDESTLQFMTELLSELDISSPGKSDVIKFSRERLKRLQRYTAIETSASDAIGNAIFRSLQSEFCGEIVNKSQSDPAKITVVDGETTVFELTLSDQEILSFTGEDNIGIEDATFIDGPAVIQFIDSLSGYSLLGETTRLSFTMPFHTVDLMQKLRSSTTGRLVLKSSSLNFSDTYKGKMYFDPKEKNFFLDKGGYRISSNNIASGVKAFGVLDMLLDGGYVHEDTALILDEPETNLHPKWQVEYARALCTLAIRGVKILITTHSPYMVEVLKALSHEKKINAGFYLAAKNLNGDAVYMESSNDISPLVEALSEPLLSFFEELNDDF